ncbi:isopentenyl-diphosphate Delta-isomerase [Kutzneria viridogrisea]
MHGYSVQERGPEPIATITRYCGEVAELVVLCAPDGSAAGELPKSEVHHADTPLHLAFSCYVFDRRGRLLTTRRALTKLTWPGVLTNTCCGHPGPGESMRDAITRRLGQELRLTVQGLDLVLPTFRYRAVMADGTVENELCPVYRAIAEDEAEPDPDPSEVHEAAWVPWRQYADSALADPASVSPWSAIQVAELDALGPDPLTWPAGDPGQLPAAATP